MDIAEFYDADPARRGSQEFEYGRDWTDGDGNRTEVSWIAATGELYAMREPVEPIVADMFGDEHLQRMPTRAVTVEVLGVVADRAELDRLLAGWGNAMPKPDSLSWVRDRLAHGPAAPDPSAGASPDIAFEVGSPEGASVVVSAAIKAFQETLPAETTPALVELHEQALVAGADPRAEWHRAYACARWAEKLVAMPTHRHLAVHARRAVEVVREIGITFGAELRDLENVPFGRSVSPRFETELAWVYEAVHVANAVAEKSSWDDVPWQDLLREMLAIHAA
jgi:hypothetical protein